MLFRYQIYMEQEVFGMIKKAFNKSKALEKTFA